MQKQILTLTLLMTGLISSAFAAESIKGTQTCTGTAVVQIDDLDVREKAVTVTIEKDLSYATTNGRSQYDLSSIVLNVQHKDPETAVVTGENQYFKCTYTSNDAGETHECAAEDADRHAAYTALKVTVSGSQGEVQTQGYGTVTLTRCQ